MAAVAGATSAVLARTSMTECDPAGVGCTGTEVDFTDERTQCTLTDCMTILPTHRASTPPLTSMVTPASSTSREAVVPVPTPNSISTPTGDANTNSGRGRRGISPDLRVDRSGGRRRSVRRPCRRLPRTCHYRRRRDRRVEPSNTTFYLLLIYGCVEGGVALESYSRRELLGLVILLWLAGSISDLRAIRLAYGLQGFGRFGYGGDTPQEYTDSDTEASHDLESDRN